ncbi:hypothetical protein AURDEDRAFT_178393 [Auricularia subglabra TFB-10046 SS5]|uniref:SUN domain-containing protein n=1 Tax=Auricularia subglabra (strain TFB-10046 / SS5) TaxID=717982 RepID=J0CQN7_AURST|nr:hypothetical protein AURDEDRAFT_178393 [Auricularia subglabra TFB-10046 SS5]
MASPRLASHMFAAPRRAARPQGRPRFTGCSLYLLIVLFVPVLLEAYHRVAPYLGSRFPDPVRCSDVDHPVNHAAFSRGARIIDSLTTPSLPTPIPNLYSSTFANIDVGRQVLGSHGPPSIPEAALGLFDDARALWFFDGEEGQLTVALAKPVLVSALRIHAHGVPRTCWPRHVSVWGLIPSSDAHRANRNLFDWPRSGFPEPLRAPFATTRSSFVKVASPRWVPMGRTENVSMGGNFTDIAISRTTQNFPVTVVSLEFKRNWGERFTCFSGLAVYDSLDESSM